LKKIAKTTKTKLEKYQTGRDSTTSDIFLDLFLLFLRFFQRFSIFFACCQHKFSNKKITRKIIGRYFCWPLYFFKGKL